MSRSKSHPLLAAVICALGVGTLVFATGCPTADKLLIETPPEMVAVEHGSDEYVAMTHDGVVVRVKRLTQGDDRTDDVPVAETEFWMKAARDRVRDTGGYELLSEQEVVSADQQSGYRLEFGRDQNGQTFRYVLAVFSTDEQLHVIDAGGPEEQFDGVRDAINTFITDYRLEE